MAKISWRKVGVFAGCVLVAGLFSWKFQAQYHENGNALTVVTTVFSILAGFMMTVMTIVGDERVLRGANWRQDTYYLGEARRDLNRHGVLLHLYLMVLVLSFLASMKFEWSDLTQRALEHVLLFLACLAMLASFSLPGQLKRRHLADLKKTIEERRDEQIRRGSSDQSHD